MPVSESIVSIRDRILNLMRNTRYLDHPDKKCGISVRHYKQTIEEHRIKVQHKYLVTIFFGDWPKEEEKEPCLEGFCYDFRTLLAEDCVRLDRGQSWIPIPLGVKRWNYLRKNRRDIHELSRRTGYLFYPLTREESNFLNENIRNHPMLCSVVKGCYPISLEQMAHKFDVHNLYDTTETIRFGAAIDAPCDLPRKLESMRLPENVIVATSPTDPVSTEIVPVVIPATPTTETQIIPVVVVSQEPIPSVETTAAVESMVAEIQEKIKTDTPPIPPANVQPTPNKNMIATIMEEFKTELQELDFWGIPEVQRKVLHHSTEDKIYKKLLEGKTDKQIVSDLMDEIFTSLFVRS